MAHVGRFAPVHFRRDLCVGCADYRVTLARNYVMNGRITNVGGSPVSLTLNPHLLVSVDEKGPALPNWSTDSWTEAGALWRATMEVYGWDFPNQYTLLKFSIYKNAQLGAQWTSRFLFPSSCDSYGVAFTIWTLVFRDFAVYPAGTVTLQLTGNAKPW